MIYIEYGASLITLKIPAANDMKFVNISCGFDDIKGRLDGVRMLEGRGDW